MNAIKMVKTMETMKTMKAMENFHTIETNWHLKAINDPNQSITYIKKTIENLQIIKPINAAQIIKTMKNMKWSQICQTEIFEKSYL